MLLRLLCIRVLYVILALWPPVLQYQLPALLFDCFIRFVFLVRSSCVWWAGAGAGAGVGLPQAGSVPPVFFIAGRPKAALLLRFFGDFRCGALLFVVIHVIYTYKNR